MLRARPGGRAHGYATSSRPRCGRRSTPPTCSWWTATSARGCARARTRSTATSRSAARSSGGSPRARCCATRPPRSSPPAGASSPADMVLRMLRVALPPGVPEPTSTVEQGQALALLQAVGGFQAYRRAVPAPPNALPVARFLVFERTYPDSVAASVDAVHNALVPRRRQPAQLRAGPAPAAPERRPRVPRARGGLRRRRARRLRVGPGGAGPGRPDIADRYFAGAAAHDGGG